GNILGLLGTSADQEERPRSNAAQTALHASVATHQFEPLGMVGEPRVNTTVSKVHRSGRSAAQPRELSKSMSCTNEFVKLATYAKRYRLRSMAGSRGSWATLAWRAASSRSNGSNAIAYGPTPTRTVLSIVCVSGLKIVIDAASKDTMNTRSEYVWSVS